MVQRLEEISWPLEANLSGFIRWEMVSADGKSAEIKGSMQNGLNPVLYLAVPGTLYGFVASAVLSAPLFRGEWPSPLVFLTLAVGGFCALIWWGAIRASRPASEPPVVARLRGLLNE